MYKRHITHRPLYLLEKVYMSYIVRRPWHLRDRVHMSHFAHCIPLLSTLMSAWNSASHTLLTDRDIFVTELVTFCSLTLFPCPTFLMFSWRSAQVIHYPPDHGTIVKETHRPPTMTSSWQSVQVKLCPFTLFPRHTIRLPSLYELGQMTLCRPPTMVSSWAHTFVTYCASQTLSTDHGVFVSITDRTFVTLCASQILSTDNGIFVNMTDHDAFVTHCASQTLFTDHGQPALM